MTNSLVGWYLFTVHLQASHTVLQNPSFLGGEVNPDSIEVAPTAVLAYWNGYILRAPANQA